MQVELALPPGEGRLAASVIVVGLNRGGAGGRVGRVGRVGQVGRVGRVGW